MTYASLEAARNRIAVLRNWRGNQDIDAEIMVSLIEEIEYLERRNDLPPVAQNRAPQTRCSASIRRTP